MKSLMLILLLISFPSSSEQYNPDNLKTFFTSINERYQLNQQRNAKAPPPLIKLTTHKKTYPVKINFQGIIIKPHTEPVIFLNDTDSTHLKLFSIQSFSTKDYILSIKFKNETIKLKPGQHWHSHTNITQQKNQLEYIPNRK